MTRKLPTARTPAKPPLVVALAVLALGAAPSVASADAGIPLDTAISQQYQAAKAVVETAVEAPATPLDPPIPAPAEVTPPAVPEPAPEEPQYHPEEAPQYQVNDAPSNSDFVSQAAPEPAPAEPAEQPAEDAPAPAREEAPQPPAEKRELEPEPAVENVAAMVGALTEVADAPDAQAAVPQLDLPTTDAPSVEPPSVEIPVDAPEPPPAPVAPAGNVNVSIRILSPGDDGPVTQVVGSGGTGPPASVAAPTTWTWNWNWIGAPGCDPGDVGPVAPAPGVAGWTWNWTWTCDGGGSLSPVDAPPIVIGIPAVDLPGLETLPGMESLPGIESLPDLDILDTSISPGGTPGKPAADAPESRAGRARSGGTSPLLPRGGSVVWAQPPPSAGIAVLATPAVGKPAVKRASKRARSRDTTRARQLIPALSAPRAPSAAVASAAGAAGAGGAPAVLTPLTLLVLSLLAGTLIAGVGLPRLKRRAARLERPG